MPRILFAAACLAVILPGLHQAAHIINQVLLAGILAVMLEPLVSQLTERRVPRSVACMLVMLALLVPVVVTVLRLTAMTPDLALFGRQLPSLLTGRLSLLTHMLSQMGMSLSPEELFSFIDAGKLLRSLSVMLSQIPGMLSWWVVVFLMLLFILYELPRLKALWGRYLAEYCPVMSVPLEEGIQSVMVYARVKTLTSLLGGVIIWGGAHLLGLKSAFIWGVLMFVCNYVPVFGPFIAAFPPVIQSAVMFGPAVSASVAVFFVILNLILSTFLEPVVLGRRLNMTLTLQLLAFMFWQSVLGVIGAILAVPLTYLMKKILLTKILLP
ncbi:pheromone autoinducer 2 transporter [Erwinia typographi]|uniref:Pheromone autoinducer 2 transporter n=2 Tax=Erwinia typographi TaxID=371042 RepID=A0A0A3YTB4_9GAMM|nr:AI-2E family transporter [Erwinia typographi]KGT88769.1 pheromone autoinducer 2 transporter [Erwinia typographi]